MAKVLIGCETSGIVREAFLAAGLDPDEEGKPVDNFPRYIVTNMGRVFSLWKEKPRLLNPGVDAKGYQCVSLRSDDGRRHSARVHRLVAFAFLVKPDDGECVRHLDGNPANNVASNLAWGTYRQNESDKICHGTWETRRTGKLSKQDRFKIRAALAQGATHKTIAAEFGVSRPTITRIANGTTWGNEQ